MKILTHNSNNNFWDSFLLSEGIIYNNDDNKLCKDSDLIISDINLELQNDLFNNNNKTVFLIQKSKLIKFSKIKNIKLNKMILPFENKNFSKTHIKLKEKIKSKIRYVDFCFLQINNTRLYGYEDDIVNFWSESNVYLKHLLINEKHEIYATEKLCSISKKNIRIYLNHIFLNISQFLNKPIISIWKFPKTYKSIFNLRIDVDPDRNTKELEALKIIKNTFDVCNDFLDRTTFMINFYRRVPNYNFFRDFTDINKADVQSHAFFHCMMPSKKFNEMNIKIAEKIIERNGLSVSGFVAPEYFWYNNIADILEKRNYKNSNSLGFDYSNYPYNPVINEKLYNYIELPVEPITYNKFIKFSNQKNKNHLNKDYFDYIENKFNILGEPICIYGHPGVEGRHPEILKQILKLPDKHKDILPIQLKTWTDWLNNRKKVIQNIAVTIFENKINYECTDNNNITTQDFSLCLQYKKSEIMLYNLDVGKKSIDISDYSKKYNLKDPIDVNLGQVFLMDKHVRIYKTYKHYERLVYYWFLYFKYRIKKLYP